jgi:hypothetical protein
MDVGHIVFLVIFGVMLIAGAILAARSIFALGRLTGMQQAIYGMTTGISTHHERAGEPIPEPVATCIDKMKANVAKAPNARKKCDAYSYHFRRLGDVTGEAAWNAGFDAGHRITSPQDGEIRVDLAITDLMQIRRLANVGFEKMVWDKDSPFAFEDQNDAEEATQAIERLEFRIPKEQRDPDYPHAHSFNRQTMIWRRWPSEK